MATVFLERLYSDRQLREEQNILPPPGLAEALWPSQQLFEARDDVNVADREGLKSPNS